MATLLVVDLPALLDTSKVGADAARELEKAWNEAKSKPEEERRELLAKLQARRDGLREQLLARAKPLVAQLAKEKKADAVLEKGAVLWSTAEDITQALIARVDAGGPLKG
jgi:Skp family chaperone for outer membrane proteins